MSDETINFGKAKDGADTTVLFWMQFTEPGFPQGILEIELDGTTRVEREAARDLGNGTFQIDATMLEMPHQGEHEQLGPIDFHLKATPPSTGKIVGAWDRTKKQPVMDLEHPATGTFDLNLEMQAGEQILETREPAIAMNASIYSFYPRTPYIHVLKTGPLKLYKKGTQQAVAIVGAGLHVIRRRRGRHHDPHGHERCCPAPEWRLEAHGHRGCWEVGAREPREQTIFVASGPAMKHGTLAYVTVTNQGPGAVRVRYDGPPPAGQDPFVWLARCASVTVAAVREVKIDSSDGADARGYYVIWWCCPEFGERGTA